MKAISGMERFYKGVGQGVEPGRGLLATDVLGLIDLEQVHVVSS